MPQLEDLEEIIRKDSRDIKRGLENLGGVPSIKLLKVFTSSCRNYKPQVHDRRPLQGKHQGMVLALIDVDLTITCSSLDKYTEEFTVTHESVHLIRKDLPLVSIPIYLKQFRRLPNNALPAIYRSHLIYYRGNEILNIDDIDITSQILNQNKQEKYINIESQYKTVREYITEQIASNILEYIQEQQRITPTFAMNVFGVDK